MTERAPLVTLGDVQRAAARLKGIAHRTPLSPNATFSELAGADVWFKMENLQRTGSFKLRGAYNKIATLPEAARERGVVAASAGNHAQGVALGAKLAGIPATIVMPRHASLSKAEAVRGYGADLILDGADYQDAETLAFQKADETGATFVHAFNDPEVISGQGTVALEILEDLPGADCLVVPIGGGGLVSGVAAAAKGINPDIRIVGVVPEGAASLPGSLEAGRIVPLDRVSTMADGLATRQVGALTFQHIQGLVDDVVVVPEDDIAHAILLLLERAKTVVEGAGAVGVAALLSGQVATADEKVVVLLSGGNIDVNLLDQVIVRGLVRTGRRLRFTTVLPDRPGALVELLGHLAQTGANVEHIEHDRTRLDVDLRQAVVTLDIDCRGPEHIDEIKAALRERGYVLE